ncbi:MAG: phage tail protein [Myxococcales bacterium FL481]|nr:MAG: phage tail protein [Myxococcales bacterium FL481]
MGADPFIGEIQLFGGDFAPRGWAFCNGALLQISDHSALYAIIGTRFGGDGQVTFGLPDLRGRAAAGVGHGPGLTARTLGEKFGSEGVPLTESELPSHSHVAGAVVDVNVQASTTRGSASQPAAGSMLGAGFDVETSQNMTNYRTNASNQVLLGGLQGSLSVTLADAGSSAPHNNMMPWQGLSFIIALEGTFPPRN